MSTFVFDIDAALESARSVTGDTATPATVATTEQTKAHLSQLSQLSQRTHSSASTLQGLNVTAVATVAARPSPGNLTYRCSVCGQPARFGLGVRLREGQEGRWFCAAHRPQEAGTS
jgi:hypothetical protein